MFNSIDSQIPRTQSRTPVTEDYAKQMEYAQSRMDEKKKSVRQTISHLYCTIHFKILKQGDTWIYAQTATRENEGENKILISVPRNGNIQNVTRINDCYVGKVHVITSLNKGTNAIETNIGLQELPIEGRIF